MKKDVHLLICSGCCELREDHLEGTRMDCAYVMGHQEPLVAALVDEDDEDLARGGDQDHGEDRDGRHIQNDCAIRLSHA